MKKIIPFSNGTEAMIWLENNCEICKTTKNCSAKLNIENGFISGEITIKAANFIGYDKKISFDCLHKNKRTVKKIVENKEQTLNLWI